MNREQLRDVISKRTSEMLDNPDDSGIYHTTIFFNLLIEDIISLLPPDTLEEKIEKEKSEYRCGEDRRPRWVTFNTETGEIIKDEKYEHQDGNFSNMCASSYCRCQE